jgi:hypothetical protein
LIEKARHDEIITKKGRRKTGSEKRLRNKEKKLKKLGNKGRNKERKALRIDGRKEKRKEIIFLVRCVFVFRPIQVQKRRCRTIICVLKMLKEDTTVHFCSIVTPV